MPEAVELMPGPASVWLTSVPASPVAPVDVAMTAPDPGILFAHTFEAGSPLRGDFATSQGLYFLSALDGACRLPLNLGASEEAQVLLTVAGDGTCTLAVAWQGGWEAAYRPKHGEGVFITNHNAGDATGHVKCVVIALAMTSRMGYPGDRTHSPTTTMPTLMTRGSVVVTQFRSTLLSCPSRRST